MPPGWLVCKLLLLLIFFLVVRHGNFLLRNVLLICRRNITVRNTHFPQHFSSFFSIYFHFTCFHLSCGALLLLYVLLLLTIITLQFASHTQFTINNNKLEFDRSYGFHCSFVRFSIIKKKTCKLNSFDCSFN